MRTIGLTGGMGSGKSSVARWFKRQGVPVLDADGIVHHLLKEDINVLAELTQEFGLDIIGSNGQIDRRALGRKVFADELIRKKLEELLHPRVLELMVTETSQLQAAGQKLCVWDVPLLLEAGWQQEVDEIWVIWVPRNIQIQRVRQRDDWPYDQIIKRLKAQMNLDRKKDYADVLIDNSGSWEDSKNQLAREWLRLVDIK